MKKFNLTKGLLVGLLVLALCFTAFGAVKANAEDTPTPAEVTFTVTNIYNGANEAYEFKTSVLTDGTGTVKLADVLAGAKKGSDALEDPTAWQVGSDVTGGTLDNGTITVTNGSTAVSFDIVPTKINVVFKTTIKASDDTAETEYKSAIAVDNKKANAAISIPYMDIAVGFKKTVGNEEKALTGSYVVTKIGETDVDSAIAKYEVAANLFDPAPLAEDIVVDKVELDEAYALSYDPELDSLVFTSPVKDLKIYFVNVKKDSGAKLAGSAFKSVTTAVPTTGEDKTPVATVPLATGDLKTAVTKDLFLNVGIIAPAAEKSDVECNTIINKATIKKVVVGINYAKADDSDEAKGILAISSIQFDKNAALTEAGDTPEATPFKDAIERLQYSTDGNKWYDVEVKEIEVETTEAAGGNEGEDPEPGTGNDDPQDPGTGNDDPQDPAEKETVWVGFSGKVLYDLVNGTNKTLYFRYLGSDYEEKVDGTTVTVINPTRTAKPAKVSLKLAKAGKAVKIDVAKTALAIKNGYDFAITDASATKAPALGEWMTILLAKGGSATTPYIKTEEFIPVKKVADNGAMFAPKTGKVNAAGIEDMVEMINTKMSKNYSLATGFKIWVRKSATAAAPAQKAVAIEIKAQAAAPELKNSSNVYAVADEKGTLVVPALSSGSGTIEYLIVKADDIDLTNGYVDVLSKLNKTECKWAKLKVGGKLVVGKASSKYALKDEAKGSKKALAAGDYILIRLAGDKSSGKIASRYLITQVLDNQTVTVSGKEETGKTTWVRVDAQAAKDPDPSISLSKSATKLEVGGTETLSVTKYPADAEVTWTSSNENVVTVANGVITAVALGEATITAAIDENTTATCTVKVVQMVRIVLNIENGSVITYSMGEGVDAGADISITESTSVEIEDKYLNLLVESNNNASTFHIIYSADGKTGWDQYWPSGDKGGMNLDVDCRPVVTIIENDDN